MSKPAAVHAAFLLKNLNRRVKSRAAIIAIAMSGLSIADPVHAEDASAGKPQSGGIIRYGHFQEPPCLSGGWVQQWYLQRQFSDNLVARAEDGRILPWLATAWTISDDRKTYTFQIKPDVRFTDGTSLDAQAVVDNINGWLSDNAELENPTAGPYLRGVFESAAATGLRPETTSSAPRHWVMAAQGGSWRDYRLPIPAEMAGQRQAAIRLRAPTFMPMLRDPASDDMRALSLMISAVRVE